MKMKINVLIETKNIENQSWLEQRRKGLGGSDAAAVVGLNPYKSSVHVYLDKIGELPPIEDNERMRIGRDLEDYVARRFMEATGMKVRRRNAILQHPEYDFMLANVDRLIVGKNEGLECKTTNSYAKKDWEEDIPVHYEIQCHHYMAVTGYDAWWIAVLIGNEKVVYKRIERDETVIEDLINAEKYFWENYVEKRQMPAPDGSDEASEIIKDLYPDVEPTTITLDHMKDRMSRYDEVVELYKELEKEKKQIEQEILKEMQESQIAYIGERKVKRTLINQKRIDSKRLKEEKPELYEAYQKESSYIRLYL
jgi:putative phage-type endonuclease